MSQLRVYEWVFEHARKTPEASALRSPDDRLSYGVLAQRIVLASRALQWAGVRAGDRVLVVLPNVPAAVVVSLAIQYTGAIAVEASREWTPEQLAMLMDQVHPRAVAFSARDARVLAPFAAAREIATTLLVSAGGTAQPAHGDLGPAKTVLLTPGGALVSPESRDLPAELPPPESQPDEVTLLLCTSGSTGTPRAVMQTTRNIAENTRSIVDVLQLSARDRAMLVLPLSYCYGRSVLQTHLFVGGSVVLDTRFMYPRIVLEAIGAERCTGFAGVPLTFELLRRSAAVETHPMASLRYVTQAGGAMSPETTDWVRAAFHPAPLFVMYGQTEATARLAYLPPGRAAEKRGSIGIPIPRVELHVVNDAGADVGCHAEGHLIARGPNVTPGYYGAPLETAGILRDGWLWTGDLARRDEDGFYYLLGRAKDVLKIGGHRASPAQIEAVLAEHGDVVEVAVAGLAHPLMGEVPGALVVVKPGARVTARELQRFCAERLPHHLRPRVVRLAPQLPRGPSGKVLRQQIARSLAAELTEWRLNGDAGRLA